MSAMMGRARKRWLSMFLAVALLLSVSHVVSAAANNESDVTGHWAEEDLNKWIEAGLLKGYEEGLYQPEKVITRAEFVALMNRAFAFSEKSDDAKFSDVESAKWYYEPIAVAVNEGYINGFPNGEFRPEQAVTREQSAIMVSKLLRLEGTAAEEADKFTDASAFTAEGKASIASLVEKELLKGLPDGSFAPDKPLTRAQAVTLLEDALQFTQQTTVFDKPGEYGPASGKEIIYGNVVVSASGVTLQNVVITGNLTVSEEVGEGEAFFKGLTVEGDVLVEGGGPNSVHFEDSVLVRITVDKNDGSVRVVVAGETSIQYIKVNSPVKIEESIASDTRIAQVDLSPALPEGSQVELLGHFESVNVMSSNVKVKIPKGSVESLNVAEGAADNQITVDKEATILKLVLDTVTKLLGEGKVEDAVVNKGAEGSSFETKPVSVDGEGAPAPTPAPAPAPPVVVNPNPTPSPSPDPETPQNPCTSDECKIAELTSLQIGDLELNHLNANDILTGDTGFEPDAFKYSAANTLDSPQTIPLSLTSPDLSTVTLRISMTEGNNNTSQLVVLEQNEYNLELKPDQDVRLDITVTSGDELSRKYYSVIIYRDRSIQDSFKITTNYNYGGSNQEWSTSYSLNAGFINGGRLSDSDQVNLYTSSAKEQLISSGDGWGVYIPNSFFATTPNSFYIEVIRNNEIIAQGDYQFNLTPINLIPEDVGIEVIPATKQELIDLVHEMPFLSGPLKSATKTYINFDKLYQELPNVKYYMSSVEWLYAPRSVPRPAFTLEDIKTGVVPEGISAPILSSINEFHHSSGRIEMGGSYSYQNDSGPKTVNDQIVYYIFFDENYEVIGYVFVPVTFDAEHVADGYVPGNTWQPESP